MNKLVLVLNFLLFSIRLLPIKDKNPRTHPISEVHDYNYYSPDLFSFFLKKVLYFFMCLSNLSTEYLSISCKGFLLYQYLYAICIYSKYKN